MSIWSSTTTAPIRPNSSAAGCSDTLASRSTTRLPTAPGSTRSSAGSPCSPRSRSAVGRIAARKNWRLRFGSISRSITTTPSPLSGSRQPTRFSPASLAFADELLSRDTRGAGGTNNQGKHHLLLDGSFGSAIDEHIDDTENNEDTDHDCRDGGRPPSVKAAADESLANQHR